MNELEYEDVLLNGFEAVDLRRENTRLKQRLQVMEMRLRQAEAKTVPTTKKTRSDTKRRADDFEALYKATLARCEVLRRRVKELGG